MSLFSAHDLAYSIGDRVLFAGLTFSLDPKARLALVGANGSGKTTLLRMLYGELSSEAGQIVRKKGLRVAYLPQSGLEFNAGALSDELEKAFAEYTDILATIDELGEKLGSTNLAPGQMESILEEQTRLHELIESSSYYSRAARIGQVARGLGFVPEDMGKPCYQFSGGWQMRIGLAKILLQNPDVMLLDEPTNYLDLDARDWLREYLRGFEGAAILVSHDRYFLDQCATAIGELFNTRLRVYPGTYSQYEAKRALEMEQLVAAYKKQEAEIEHMEKFVERFQYKATKAAQAQSRIKQLEKIERIEIPESLKKIEFRFPPPPPSSDLVLEVEGLRKSYPDKPVLNDVGFSLKRGEKLALLGRNGAGKSTLMRILAESDRPDAGTVRYGHQVRIAYFAQDAENSLNHDLSIWEEIETAAPGIPSQTLRNLLGAFLFGGDDIEKKIAVLSGGEKSRVALVKLLLSPSNVLILDEPTNHLDLVAKDILLTALTQFEGTVIFVSHDRQFIQALATRFIELKPGPVGSPSVFTRYDGDWDYFQWKSASTASSEVPAETSRSREPQENKAKHEEQKNAKSQVRKLQKREDEVLSLIDAMEEEARILTESLGEAAVYLNPKEMETRKRRIREIEEESSALHGEWETLARQLEDAR